MSSSYDSSSDDEHGLFEEEDITIILALHVNKRSKHGGSIFGGRTCEGRGLKGTTS
jgi:hypothetical protein